MNGIDTRRPSASVSVVVASARNAAGEANTVVVSGLSPEGPGAYGVNLTAVVSRVTRSAATPDRVEALTFRASGAALAPLFDGQETLLSVTSFPWYVREISVP